MKDRAARPLKTLEKAAALFVLLGALATLAYAFGEIWIG